MNKTQTTVASIATAAAIIGGGVVVYESYDNANENILQINWSLYDLNLPSVDVPQSNSSIYLPDTNVILASVDSVKIEPVNVNSLMNIEENSKAIENNKKTFVDSRMIWYDGQMSISNNTIKQWRQIYSQYSSINPIDYVPINKPFRMISQVRTPNNEKELNILMKNLIYYKSQGYDSVLYGFVKDDKPSNVLNTILYIIKYCDMNVWLTYTGQELLQETVFMDVKKYTQILRESAPYISGYVNSWRRTSVHLWKQDDAFMNYTNIILRQSNPNLPIVGQLYYGNNYKFQEDGNVGFELNNFENSSAVMVVNFGFTKIDVKYLLNNILPKYVDKNVAKIACVVGQKPYYLTKFPNGLNYQDNMKIKHEIENDFLRNGFIGTITLSDDGYQLETNVLTRTLFDTLNAN